jgi:hyperosmotically inducible periplasmic protein
MCANELRPGLEAGIMLTDSTKGHIMKTNAVVTCIAMASLFGSAVVIAEGDSDSDRSHPMAFVKDSAITTKIKTKLAADHPTSLALIHVDTDKDGVVWLTGTARSQDDIEQALTIARATEGVKSVHNGVTVKKDD